MQTPSETLPDGTPFDDRLRRLFAAATQAGQLDGSPFDAAGMQAFHRWLDSAADDERAGGVSRFQFDVWLGRPDLQEVFADLRDAPHREAFLDWVVAHGAHELAIPDWLLPEDRLRDRDPPAARAPGVNLAGATASEPDATGVAGAVTAALDAAGVAVLPLGGAPSPPAGSHEAVGADAARFAVNLLCVAPDAARFAVNLLCVAPDAGARFAAAAGPGLFAGRHTIAAWEEPPRADPVVAHLDELWVGSGWLHEAIASRVSIDVRRMPVAVPLPLPPLRSRAQLGLPEGFLVVSLVDLDIPLQRSNPIGLVEAFAAAFAPGAGASLVVHAINGRRHPRDGLALRLAAARHPDVHVTERPLGAGEHAATIAACDLYASLHRAVGFGRPLAEAIALGRPALATRWSGNLEFMRPETTRLVPCEPLPADEHEQLERWAEPDLAAAAAAMREVRADPEQAARSAAAAAARLLADHDPARVGAVMRARLEELEPAAPGARPGARGAHGAATAAAIAAVEERGDRESAARPGKGIRSSRQAAERPDGPPIEATLLDATLEVSEQASRLQAGLDAEAANHAGLTARSAAHERRVERLERRLDQLAASTDGLTRRLQPLTRAAEAIPWTQGDPFTTFDHPLAGRVLGFRDARPAPDGSTGYRTFEDLFRGDRERVRGLLTRYVDVLRGHEPVLDVGAGRGELLELLRDAGMQARGVDHDSGMAAGASELGLDVTVADGVEHLESLEPSSLGAVTAIHVIEHLPLAVLERFFAAARRALRPGGLLVCETVNPHAGFALKTFWVDPTHQHPLFPEVALVLALTAGMPTAFVTHLRGTGDVDADRYNEDSYTLVAEAPAPAPSAD